MNVEKLKEMVYSNFRSKSGASSITENKKVQMMFDSLIETIAPYMVPPKKSLFRRFIDWSK